MTQVKLCANGFLLLGIHTSFEDMLHVLDMTLATTLRDEEILGLPLQAQMDRFAPQRFNKDGIFPRIWA